jgi:type I restriction enzyme S subunit
MAKLSDIFDLQMGKTPARANSDYWNNGTNSWVSIADLSSYEKYVGETKEKITDIAILESGIKAVPPNTVIMSFKLSLGKTAIAKNAVYTNEAIMAFIPNGCYNISPDYFFYMLSGRDWSKGTNRAVMGATLNKATLGEINVTVPLIEEQRYVAAVLDKLTGLISLRKQQLAKLDELVKARFVEIFGDMLLNPLSWSEKPLENMADIVSGITKGRKTQSTEFIEVPYMAVSNVKDGYIDWTTVKMIMATQSEINQYRILPDDVLMTEGGDPDKLGRGAIIREPMENCIHQNHIFRVRLNRKTILPEFFAEYLQHQKSKRYFLRCAKQTTGIASINMKQLRALPVLLPPIGIQEMFADFVAGVERQKLTIQQSLDKLEVLKKSLMQEYFG